MYYRRFGRTELQMPVLSCGGMRFQQSWNDLPPEAIEEEGQRNLEATIERARGGALLSELASALVESDPEVELEEVTEAAGVIPVAEVAVHYIGYRHCRLTLKIRMRIRP